MDEKQTELKLNQLQLATEMGYDIHDPKSVENLIACIRYCDVRFSNRRLRDPEICDMIGITSSVLLDLKHGDAIKVATAIVLSEFMNDAKRHDIRAELFQIYHDGLPNALRNLMKIAQGGDMNTNPGGPPVYAPFRDQVTAAGVLLDNPLGTAFLTNTFVGEGYSLEESNHLQMRQALLERANIIDLDTVEGDFRES